jgi:hypothetical protein
VFGSARAAKIQRCASSRACDAFSAVYVPSNSTITFEANSLSEKGQIRDTLYTIYSVINATLHLKIKYFTLPPPHDT